MRFFSICLVLLCVLSTVYADKVIQPAKVPGAWAPAEINSFPPLQNIITAEGAGRKIYGLYAWAGEYLLLRDQIKKAGWKQCRIAGPWTDKIMRATIEDGIEVMPTLGMYLNGKRKTRNDFQSDADFISYTVQGLEKFLKRYGPDGTFFKDNPNLPIKPVMHIEIWNEPNFQYMIPPDNRPRKTLEAKREKLYARLLAAIYKNIKPRWPAVKIVAFASGGENCGDLRFIDHVHQLDKAAKSYDVLSTHPYVGSAPPEAFSLRSWGRYSMPDNFAKIRQTMTKHGRSAAPVWYTEVGWPISQREGGQFKDRQKKRIVPKIFQAAYVVRTYALALRLGVRRVNIMFIVDSDGFNGGFFARSGEWRPSAHAVAAMIKLMPDPQITGAVSDGYAGYYAYMFNPDRKKPNNQQVIMLWNITRPINATVPCSGKFTIYDMLGNRLRHGEAGGKISIQTGPCPSYIVIEK